MSNLSDLARELCEQFPPTIQGDPCPGCHLAARLATLGATTEWGLKIPFAGDPDRVLPVPDQAAATEGSRLLSSETIPAVIVTRTVTTWTPA